MLFVYIIELHLNCTTYEVSYTNFQIGVNVERKSNGVMIINRISVVLLCEMLLFP